MQWTDEALVLNVKPHGETAAIVEVFTRQNGRALGLVHGGRSRRLRPLLQPGNLVEVTWKGRLAEHLGSLNLELKKSHAAMAMDDALNLSALTSLCSWLHLLAEREPHPNLYEVALFVFDYLQDNDVWPALAVRWELTFLEEMGFGLDLSACAATGSNDDLVYVSPRTGRAVSASAGEPYRDKLLSYPAFLQRGRGAAVTDQDILRGFALTGYFLEERLLKPRDLKFPDSRRRMVSLLERRMTSRVV
jgi:DNA repair protein RecO (recombination protein O)